MAASKKAAPKKPDENTAPLSLSAFSELIASFYDSPLRQEPAWQDCLESVRDFFAANYVVSIFRPPAPDNYSQVSYSSYSHISYSGDRQVHDVSQFYNDNFIALDPFVNLPLDKAFMVQDFVAESEWKDHLFYKQFLEPMDVFHVVGADIRTDDGVDCQIRVCRPASAPPFTDMDKEYLQLLIQHMKRCVQLHAQQREEQSTNELFASVIDRLMFGSIILDQSGTMLRMNKIAEDTLKRKDGLALTSGRIHAISDSENKELQELIANALNDREKGQPSILGAFSVSRPQGDCPLGVLIRNFPADTWVEGDRRASVAILFRDPMSSVEASHEAVRRLFSFTPAEAGLAMILAEGHTLDEAATQLNISRNTARTHLKAMFSKTGTTRQVDLIRMILGSVATIC